MWMTITGNYGNILPIDWSKSVAKSMHLPALNINPDPNFNNVAVDGAQTTTRRKNSMNGNSGRIQDDDGLSSEDEAVASDLDMHALILSGLPAANQEPIKGADEVLKEIDDLMEVSDHIS
jgi:hypothetical protein